MVSSAFDTCSGTFAVSSASLSMFIVVKEDARFPSFVYTVPVHCDPTVNLYDWLVGIRRHKVEVVWPILARGPGV